MPAFVSTLCICIVFVPMFFLSGVARFLFVPLAEAVVFAMLASYILSRTLVPTLVMLLMRVAHGADADRSGAPSAAAARLPRASTASSSACARAYTLALVGAARASAASFGVAVPRVSALLSCRLYPVLGRDFFPSVDAGQIRLHLRAPTGTRIEETARLADARRGGDPRARAAGPARDHPRQPRRSEQRHQPVVQQRRHHRHARRRDPAFAAAKATGRPRSSCTLLRARAAEALSRHRVLLPAGRHRHPDPELRPAGGDRRAVHRRRPRAATRRSPPNWSKTIRQIPGAVDAHVHQRLDAPALDLQMDRTRLQQIGPVGAQRRPERAVSLSGSSQTAPAFWLNPQQRRRLQRSPCRRRSTASTRSTRCSTFRSQRRGGRRHRRHHAAAGQPRRGARRRASSPVVSRYNIPPAIDVYVSVQGTDLASVAGAGAGAGRRGAAEAAARQPGRPCAARCRRCSRRSSAWASGLAMAIVLVYLLIVVNFQSWIDAVIIIAALPAALAGIAWMLFITGTTLSGAGADRRDHDHGRGDRQQHPAGRRSRASASEEGVSPRSAALEAGATRIRPVLMTALAMIIGMIPMALGTRRRRRAERAARPRRHRRPAVRDRLDAALRPRRLRRRAPAARAARARAHAARRPRAGRAQEGLNDVERTSCAAGHAPDEAATPAELRSAAQVVRGARASSPSSSLVLLALGAGAHDHRPHGATPGSLEAERQREARRYT